MKSVASKLLEGNKKEVVRFLDRLSARDAQAKEEWRRVVATTIDARILKRDGRRCTPPPRRDRRGRAVAASAGDLLMLWVANARRPSSGSPRRPTPFCGWAPRSAWCAIPVYAVRLSGGRRGSSRITRAARARCSRVGALCSRAPARVIHGSDRAADRGRPSRERAGRAAARGESPRADRFRSGSGALAALGAAVALPSRSRTRRRDPLGSSRTPRSFTLALALVALPTELDSLRSSRPPAPEPRPRRVLPRLRPEVTRGSEALRDRRSPASSSPSSATRRSSATLLYASAPSAQAHRVRRGRLGAGADLGARRARGLAGRRVRQPEAGARAAGLGFIAMGVLGARGRASLAILRACSAPSSSTSTSPWPTHWPA